LSCWFVARELERASARRPCYGAGDGRRRLGFSTGIDEDAPERGGGRGGQRDGGVGPEGGECRSELAAAADRELLVGGGGRRTAV
jgi:hypothetical protein